jgi:hypothetical protein
VFGALAQIAGAAVGVERSAALPGRHRARLYARREREQKRRADIEARWLFAWL